MPWVERKDIVGLILLISGLGILIGWFFTDKVQGVERSAIVAAIVLMILGAHFMSSEPTEKALKAVAGTAKSILPFVGKRKDEGEG